MADWAANRRDEVVGADRATTPANPDVTVVESLLTAHLAESPAWRRLAELSRSQLTAAAEAGQDRGRGRPGS